MSQLKATDEKDVVPQLIEAFNYKNVMQVPRLQKIVLNMGLGEAISSRSGYHAYDEQRFDTQWRGLLAGLSYPFGVGPGGWPTAHSLYAKTLAEHGVLGVTALAVLIGALIVPLAQRAWHEPAANTVLPAALLLALIVGQLANSFVIDSIHWRHFWTLLGLAWALLVFPESDEE